MMTYYNKTILVVITLVALYFLAVNYNTEDMENQNLVITSSAFEHNQSIPSKYTCDDKNINPDLKISGISDSAQSLVLIMDDPDAPVGMWDHWVKFDIPVSGSDFAIQEGSEPVGISGVGTSGNLDYAGPCPPDKEHRYFFKAYSLDTTIGLAEGSNKAEVEKAMEGHILQKGVLIGLYNRN